MKSLFLTLFAVIVLNFSYAHAKDSPFDGFTGDYRVLNSSCVDLLRNVESKVLALVNVSFVHTENENSFRIILAGAGFRNDLTLGADWASSFSGDGVTLARWTRTIENSYVIHVEHSLIKSADQFKYILENKYVNGNSPSNTHWKCEFELSR